MNFMAGHFVASYKECDVKALTDISALMKVLTDAVNSVVQLFCNKQKKYFREMA